MCLPDRRVRECFWRQHRSRLVRGFHAPRHHEDVSRRILGRTVGASRGGRYASRISARLGNGLQHQGQSAKCQSERPILIGRASEGRFARCRTIKCQKHWLFGLIDGRPLPRPQSVPAPDPNQAPCMARCICVRSGGTEISQKPLARSRRRGPCWLIGEVSGCFCPGSGDRKGPHLGPSFRFSGGRHFMKAFDGGAPVRLQVSAVSRYSAE